MPKLATCVCGWRRGRATARDESGQFPPENPESWYLITGIGAIVFGAILTLVGIAGRNLGPLLIGLTFAVAGIATLRITRMGTIWSGLDWEDKAGAWPGIVIGAVPFLCYVIYIRLMVLVADMVRRQPR